MAQLTTGDKRPDTGDAAARETILVWLPTPLGDAILATPALRAIRRCFTGAHITFLARPSIRDLFSPGSFNDDWFVPRTNNPLHLAAELRRRNFSKAILLKNSFGSAFAAFMAQIPVRIGYARDGRGFLLTRRLKPARMGFGFEPASMVDYYLDVASAVGCDAAGRDLELPCTNGVDLPPEIGGVGPLVILVPGGAFGPSKCWPSDRFAQLADHLVETYRARVAVSVAPLAAEADIAGRICDAARNHLINLAEHRLSMAQLRALFGLADLVVCNDTGPRHMAIAMKRKVVTLFGPNDPEWTDTGYDNEIQIVGRASCGPCARPICRRDRLYCMEAISVAAVRRAAACLLEDDRAEMDSFRRGRFRRVGDGFFVVEQFVDCLADMSLATVRDVIEFAGGRGLVKDGMAAFRRRIRLVTDKPPATLFIKTYNRPPIPVQISCWLASHRRKSLASVELDAMFDLPAIGVNTPTPVAYGQQWGLLFEKRSFVISRELSGAESLERRLPRFVVSPLDAADRLAGKQFIRQLADLVRSFHQAGYRHRDLYFSHIFYDDSGRFYLIDLARVFRPALLAERYRVKDIAQLCYSAPAEYFSRTDRLRFHRDLTGRRSLSAADKYFIRRVMRKVRSIAAHDARRGRNVGFTG